jgi:hypothetical protein
MKYRFAWGFLLLAACSPVDPASPDAGGGGDDGGGSGPQTLTVSVTGNGTVSSSPAGIDCGATCAAQFALGSSVTLTGTPAADSAFVGWSGDCAGAAACTVTMDGAKTAMAKFATHGSKRWVNQISFSGQDSIEKVAVDPGGNVVAAGTVADASGGSFLYVIKYAKDDGHTMWMQQFAFGGNVGALAVDATGEVYVSGRVLGFNGMPIYVIGTTAVVGDLFGDIVVARLAAATGTPFWVRKWGGDGQDFPKALAVSGNDLYVVGETSSTTTTYDAQSTAGSGGFIVRANATTGAAVQAKLIPGSMQIFGVAVNDTHVAVVGQLSTQLMNLDGRCTLSPAGSNSPDAMLLDLLGATLACQWGKNFGDFTADKPATGKAVAAFPGGGWAISGDFQGSILLAPSGASLTSRGGFDVFAGRFAGDGTHIWSFRYGNTGFDIGDAIAVTPQGNVVLAGTFDGSITFGPLTLNGAMNAYVTRMSTGIAPTHEWAVGLGGDSYDLGSSVALAADGTVYVLGLFNGMTTVAGTPLTSQDFDAWIASLVR